MTEPTIQPIQSHTEILIQQAYDRGYADKAMKVDEAIEMEHSAKGCTAKCHTEPIKPIANDGIYPRCVWCGGEIYALAVIAYSKAEEPCLICGKFVPEEYVK